MDIEGFPTIRIADQCYYALIFFLLEHPDALIVGLNLTICSVNFTLIPYNPVVAFLGEISDYFYNKVRTNAENIIIR